MRTEMTTWSLSIGDIRIMPASVPTRISIIRSNGEGGEFDAEAFRQIVEKFFAENF